MYSHSIGPFFIWLTGVLTFAATIKARDEHQKFNIDFETQTNFQAPINDVFEERFFTKQSLWLMKLVLVIRPNLMLGFDLKKPGLLQKW